MSSSDAPTDKMTLVSLIVSFSQLGLSDDEMEAKVDSLPKGQADGIRDLLERAGRGENILEGLYEEEESTPIREEPTSDNNSSLKLGPHKIPPNAPEQVKIFCNTIDDGDYTVEQALMLFNMCDPKEVREYLNFFPNEIIESQYDFNREYSRPVYTSSSSSSSSSSGSSGSDGSSLKSTTTFHGKKDVDPKKIYGRIQFVETNWDYTVKIINGIPDLKVKKVTAEHQSNEPGKWFFVTHTPKWKLKVVENFPDFTVRYE